MTGSKWISGLSPITPAREAARIVLAARLHGVEHYLPLAVAKAQEDVEFVHQLRVATRRSGAALKIFESAIPRKEYRRARNTLRTLRRAAGDARDWDVFLEILGASEALKGKNAVPAVDLLTGYALGERDAAQTRLIVAAAECDEEFRAMMAELANRPLVSDKHDAREESITTLAFRTLGGFLAEFHSALLADPSAPEELHRLRILGKRVRYAVEVFADASAPWLRENLYPLIEQVQEILGDVQDGHVVLQRLESVFSGVECRRPEIGLRVKPGFAALEREVKARMKAREKAFRLWRKSWDKLASGTTFSQWAPAPTTVLPEPPKEPERREPPRRPRTVRRARNATI